MPERLYTGIDLINYSEVNGIQDSSGPGIVIATPTQFSQANLLVDVACNLGANPGGGQVNAVGQYRIIGDFDFDAVPAIPPSALISSIRLKRNHSIAGTLACTSGGVNCTSSLRGLSVAYSPNILTFWNDLTIDVDDFQVAAGSSLASISESMTTSTEQEIIFDPPITRDQLETDYGTIELWVYPFIYNAGVTLPPGYTGISGNVIWTIDNFEFFVEYTENPNAPTLTPTSGDVEPGQTITITGDEEYTYAALQDDKVIPLPKKPGENPTLTVPSPPTDECSDCLGECPECEECFDPCQEDLNSEACQECLQACLDCLTECLEDLEDAEACQQSQQDDPPVSIIIICGDPTGTQFDGSVTLGSFTIIVANASGIYTLVPGKTNDTLYATARDGTTYDVKIPNPMAKTGFFRE